jgi:Tfp pilus assembly protein PilV
MKLALRQRPGLSMIETIVAMVVIAIAFSSLAAVFVTLTPRSFRIENINQKVYLAQGKMEEVLAKGYGITSIAATTFETASLKSYKFQVIVTNVATSNLDSVVASSPFKRVEVRVWGGPVDIAGTVEINTVVATIDAH